jgi:hypothetical protein
MNERARPCLVSCSVLKEEIEKLVQRGDLDVELLFVSKYFHIDYTSLEKNLRRVVEKSLPRFSGGIVLVYGDLCLGPNDEMKKLVEEYGLVKVDALNCIDCLLGGKGKVLEADPDHELLFLYPGMIGFFSHFKERAKQENIDEESFNKLFSGLKGIVLLDTIGQPEKNKEEIERLHSGLTILETRYTGLGNLKRLLLEAIEKANREAGKKPRTSLLNHSSSEPTKSLINSTISLSVFSVKGGSYGILSTSQP